jgi:hypothetical protein
MVPQLKPDIYRCIADHLAPVPAQPWHGTREIKQYQQDLLNMMKSSKVSALATGMGTAQNIDAIRDIGSHFIR